MIDTELKQKLRQPYRWDEWKTILDFLFAKVEYFVAPSNFTTTKDKVKQVRQMGTVKLDDGKNLAVFEVEVVPRIDISRNRVELRNIAATYIDQTVIHGALVFYHANGKDDYRLTFIAKQAQITESGEFVKSQTHPKRYSYVLGRNEACTTPTRRLFELGKKRSLLKLEDVTEAFSVERLNKEFFDKYKKHYERFSKYLSDSDYRITIFKIAKDKDPKKNVELEKPIRDFAKKLLGRIVFLHFLQKKGWLGVPTISDKWTGGDPEFMQNLFLQFEPGMKFHSKCLTELFFETLNSKRRNDIFPITKTRVPYLNGGLFDDDFPAARMLDFPPDYFKDLLEFFDQYNFTIDENDPDDNEVGIDPEMLGHIFENLLEENREKGAFYTPKEIVQFMCQECLIQYLQTHLGKHEAIEDFIRTGRIGDQKDKHNFIVNKAKQIEERLDDVKVCDPAIGSGAFPMGLLQEILKAKSSLDLTLDRAKAKKSIIQNSLFGVDIDSGAVDIARLRFWLALIVDEDEPRPLPNLDFKIMQGNSVLESYEGIDLSTLADKDDEESFISATEYQFELGREFTVKEPTMLFFDTKTMKELYKLIAEFFDFEEKTYRQYPSKRLIRDKISEIVEGKLRAKFYLQKYRVEYQIKEKKDQIAANKIRIKDPDGISRRKEKNTDKLKKELASNEKELSKLDNIITNLHELQDRSDKPYFLWHLWFKTIFDRGGFDIVIGNPPYRQLQKMGKEADLLEAAGYDTFTRAGDLYCLFYERGIDVMKENGVLTYITSNSWMKTQYGELLRKYFVEHTNPLKLINFEDTKIFQAVTVETNILVAQKAPFKNSLEAVAIRPDYGIGRTINDYFVENSLKLDNLNSDPWIALSLQENEIKGMIEEVGTPIKNLALKLSFGVKTGFNDAFIIDEVKKNELVQEDQVNLEILKPLLRGKDLSRFTYSYENLWLIFTKRGTDIERYPAVKKHLHRYFLDLRPKNEGESTGRKPGPYKWFEIQDNVAYWEEFERPKIIWGEISDKPKFAYDETGKYTNDRCSIMTGEQLKLVTAILNSRAVGWYFSQISTTSGMGTSMWKLYKIDQIPIPVLHSVDLELKFNTLVDYLIFLLDRTKPQVNPYAENDKLAPVFEDALNMMVYELYFGEHMKHEEIDVLKFVDTKNVFKDISTAKTEEDQKSIIGNAYSWLQKQDNPIRNRTISSNIKSPNIIRRINSSTH